MNNMSLYNDAYKNFHIVIEQTSPDIPITNISEIKKENTHFLRFRACLQSFGKRNRNKRLWTSDIMRPMCEAKEVKEAMEKGAFVGEAGHPCSTSGKVTMERIFHIDPLRCSHRITEFDWSAHNLLYGMIETLDEGVGSPGYRLMKNIAQGLQPAFSTRTVVPQRKNHDGTIDVIGTGRVVCWDRIYIPSHEEAYIDINIPVKDVVKQSEFTSVMESYCDFMLENSDKVKYIIDKMDPVVETMTYDATTDTVSIKTSEGFVFMAPELKHRQEIHSLLRNI